MNIADFRSSAGNAAELLRTLGNERRLMVLCELSRGEMSVGELAEAVGLSQSALSQHLAVLRERHLVATRRESQHVYYSLADATAAQVIDTLYRIYCHPPRP